MTMSFARSKYSRRTVGVADVAEGPKKSRKGEKTRTDARPSKPAAFPQSLLANKEPQRGCNRLGRAACSDRRSPVSVFRRCRSHGIPELGIWEASAGFIFIPMVQLPMTIPCIGRS